MFEKKNILIIISFNDQQMEQPESTRTTQVF